MRKTIVIAIAATVALAACASLRNFAAPTPFDAHNPRVYVVQGGQHLYPAVDQEPIVFASGKGKVKIRWHLQDSNYKFDRTSGIGIVAKPIHGVRNALGSCASDASDDSVFACENDTSASGTFKYTIKIVPKRSGDPVPEPLDPTVVNG
jgi:hypothetical protein